MSLGCSYLIGQLWLQAVYVYLLRDRLYKELCLEDFLKEYGKRTHDSRLVYLPEPAKLPTITVTSLHLMDSADNKISLGTSEVEHDFALIKGL